VTSLDSDLAELLSLAGFEFIEMCAESVNLVFRIDVDPLNRSHAQQCDPYDSNPLHSHPAGIWSIRTVPENGAGGKKKIAW